jgi:hypothetical protein
MEVNKMTLQHRRSTTGRSNIIESCINTLTDALKDNQFDQEEIATMVINNTLPNELRSVTWKIFLGILPKDKDLFEWVKIIQGERANFEKLSEEKEVEDYAKVIRKEAEEAILTPGALLSDFQNVVKELAKISANYDFFKSQIVAETLLRLYVIWRRNNLNEDDSPLSLESFYILAGLIYALYPSILHFNTEIKEITKKEDVDARTLFYLLNSEEHFDSDVYLVFDFIMNKLGFKNFIQNFHKLSRQEWEVVSKFIVQEEGQELFNSEEAKTLVQNMNRLEKIAYPYLKIANKQLLSHLFSIQLDSYDIVKSWFTSLMTNSICFEHLTYLWDNVFLHSQEAQTTFEFLDFILVSLFSNLSNELLSSDVVTAKKLLMRYPEHNLNLKEIIKKALKIREKISDFKALD